MPNRDGTGPFGAGSKTGRKKGWCRGGRNVGIWTLAAPLAVAIIRDLRNPGGLLRQFAHQLLTRKKAEKLNARRDADFSVLPDSSSSSKVKR